MPYLPTNIYVLNRVSHAPIQGVLVRLLDSGGRLVQSQAATDADGLASFLLPTEQSPYQVRCYKQAVAFSSPVQIDVLEGQPNDFNVYGETLQPPLSKDPRVCVAYGYFKDGTNRPFAGCTIHFMPKFEPLLIDGNAVLKERSISRTDTDGYMEIGLIRCARYDVMIEGMEDEIRTISVPDTANVNLPDLLFPVVDHVELQPTGPYQLHVGQELSVVTTVWTSSMVPLYGTAMYDVRWSSSDPSILSCTATQDTLILRGMSLGSAQVQGVRYDNSVVRIPNTPIGGLPVVVTVVP